MKQCRRCFAEKDEADFNRNRTAKDGLQGWCRVCQLNGLREWNIQHPEKRRAQLRNQYIREIERLGGPRPTKQSSLEKRRARRRLEKAVRAGLVQRPALCEVCGCSAKVQGHHDDYTKPLDVRWLCPRCHGLTHAGTLVRRSAEATA